jgi:hypothetical protein
MNDKNVDLKDSSKNWLQKLKDESWEAELLVSTISIFGAFQMFRLIDWSTNKFIDILNPNQYFIGYFIVFFGITRDKYPCFNVCYSFFSQGLLDWACRSKFCLP